MPVKILLDCLNWIHLLLLELTKDSHFLEMQAAANCFVSVPIALATEFPEIVQEVLV